MSERKPTRADADGERPRYREAIEGTTRELIAQGLRPQDARKRAAELAVRSEDREDNRR